VPPTASGKKLGWGSIAIILVIATIASMLAEETGHNVASTVSNLSSAQPMRDIQNVLQEAALAVNRKAPIQVDALTRLEGATAGPGKNFRYTYTVLDQSNRLLNLNSSRLRTMMEPTVHQGFCTSDSMKHMRSNGVTVIYEYHDEGGRLIGSIAVSPSDCH
jgi:hypothetical protein